MVHTLQHLLVKLNCTASLAEIYVEKLITLGKLKMEEVTLHLNGRISLRHFRHVLAVIENGKTYPHVQTKDINFAGQKTISNHCYTAEQIILAIFNHFVTSVIFKKMLVTTLLSIQSIRFISPLGE